LKRKYPTQPVIGVGAVIIDHGKILLVKRGSEPGRNKWSIPGGLVELGEKVHNTIVREVKEETNLDVEVHDLIDVVDNLVPDEKGKWRYHFVILDFFVCLKGGNLHAGSDVLDVQWVLLDEVEKYDLTGAFRDFFERNRQTLQRFDSRLSRKTLNSNHHSV
jgi:ADP-ribose pyrophosphatase YjhB (NUDIX family)